MVAGATLVDLELHLCSCTPTALRPAAESPGIALPSARITAPVSSSSASPPSVIPALTEEAVEQAVGELARAHAFDWLLE